MNLSCNYVGFVYEGTQKYRISLIVCALSNLILSIPTTILNLSVFIVILRSTHLPDVTRLLLANLALVNSLAGWMAQLTNFVQFILLSLRRDPCGIVEVTSPVGFVITGVSCLTLIFLALERYVSLARLFPKLKLHRSERSGLLQ